MRGRGESFYLQSALATGGNLPFAFTAKNAGAVDPAQLQEHALVILNDAGALPVALGAAVTNFVEAGGQLIIATGPHTRAESFNGAFQRVAPAALGEMVQLQRGESVAITDVKMSHPVFEVFRGSGRLASARVFGYHRTEPRERAQVLARFEDGSPALVEGGVGAKGRVLLFASTLGMTLERPAADADLPAARAADGALPRRARDARVAQARADVRGREGARGRGAARD